MSIPASNEDLMFISLYDKLMEVNHNLIEFGRERLMAESHTMECVAKKLPKRIQRSYMRSITDLEDSGCSHWKKLDELRDTL